MAYVRITDKLRDAIINQGTNLFNKPLTKARTNLAPNFHQRCFDYYFEKEIEPYMANLPKKWLIRIEYISYYIPINEVNVPSFSNLLTEPRLIPDVGYLISSKSLQTPSGYEWPDELVQEYTTFHTRVQTLETEQKEFINRLRNYLKKCNTLKQFLAGWPQGEELIPEHVLYEYKNPTPTAKKSKPKIEVAPTELNASLLRSKIMKNI